MLLFGKLLVLFLIYPLLILNLSKNLACKVLKIFKIS